MNALAPTSRIAVASLLLPTKTITGFPARPDVATQIYNQSLHTIMVAKVTQGNEPIDQVIKWAQGEVEGMLRA